jgi:ribose transport system substrate-binding protein
MGWQRLSLRYHLPSMIRTRLASLACLLTCTLSLTAGEAPAPLRIAVVPKGTTHEFWKSVHAGAVKAQREAVAAGRPVELIWRGPVREDDRTAQIDVVQGFVGQRVHGIVLAPLDSRALVAPVNLAATARVPVVIIDSALESKKPVGFVATDNRAGGRLAGEHLIRLLGGQGRVLMLRYAPGSASTQEREDGFLDALKAAPGITVVSSDQYAGATMASALTASETLLNRFGADLQGVFTPNESSSAGMAKALKDRSLAGRIKQVGFDASPVLVTALKAGEIQGLVVQDPFGMGYTGMQQMLAHLRGETPPVSTPLPPRLVTADNLHEPAVQQVVAPPLREFLGE